MESRYRPYYSVRKGKESGELHLDVVELNRLVKSLYVQLKSKGYFQEAFGYECVDGDVHGTVGPDPEAYALLLLRKKGLFPIDQSHNFTEDEIFDLVEFLFDHVSHPTEGRHHSYGGCGMHYWAFDQAEGRKEYRERVNDIIRDYGQGWELSQDGEILAMVEEGLADLLEGTSSLAPDETIQGRVDRAIRQFRSHRSSGDDRRDAVRNLADVLERLRPIAKKQLRSQDESDLFNLANNFGIRHNRPDQKTDFPEDIWLPWIFVYYLGTIRALLSLTERTQAESGEAG